MNKETLQKLSALGEWNEVIEFLTSKVLQLNTLDDLPDSKISEMNDPVEYTIEVKARLRAVQILREQLSNLIFSETEVQSHSDSRDYLVEIEDDRRERSQT